MNNGLITKIWGPPMWESFHSITFGYPISPNEEQKRNYMNYFANLGNVLPCKYCRESYNEFISEGSAKITNDIFENRDSLTKWGYRLHNRVNKKLGIDYGTTYVDLRNKYENYRAKCSNTPKIKQKGCTIPATNQSYHMNQYKDAPFVNPEIVKLFVDYAKHRDVDINALNFYNSNKNNIDNLLSDKLCSKWTKRNRICCKIISTMRIRNVDPLEKSGKYEGLPTIPELHLLMYFSSNLPGKKLLEISHKLKNLE